MEMDHGDTRRLWGQHKLEFMFLHFQIHGNPKCSQMSYKNNTLDHMHHRLNLEGNVAYTGEEESFWS